MVTSTVLAHYFSMQATNLKTWLLPKLGDSTKRQCSHTWTMRVLLSTRRISSQMISKSSASDFLRDRMEVCSTTSTLNQFSGLYTISLTVKWSEVSFSFKIKVKSPYHLNPSPLSLSLSWIDSFLSLQLLFWLLFLDEQACSSQPNAKMPLVEVRRDLGALKQTCYLFLSCGRCKISLSNSFITPLLI